LLYGFSDGGIVGLLLASKYPGLLARMAISGANTNPDAISKGWRLLFKIMYLFSGSRKIKMMLNEPHISAEQLNSIKIPVLVLAGENDIVREEDTRFIAANIQNARLKILKGENHMSYVINSPKLHPELAEFFSEDAQNAANTDFS
jgi:pimeloyl-ACP methyl ester carboxylesterase